MNDLLMKIIFATLLGLILYQLSKTPHIETFLNTPNIILIGNIFSDKDHTRFISIKEQIEKDKNLHFGEIINISKKCSSLKDFKDSVKELKRKYPELDQNDTYAFISIGYNDLLTNVHNCEKAVEVQPHSSPNPGLSKKLPCMTEADIFNKWKEQLEYFHSTFPQVNIIVLSAYYLPDESTIKECGLNLTPNRHLSSDIDQWNADLAQFCMKREWGFVAMDHEFNPKDILSGSIDLNNTAKKHLAELIKQKVH